MKCTIPEISWHNKDPVLSVDIQPSIHQNEFYRLASGGTDSHVLIWYMNMNENGSINLDLAADLTRHQRAVNVVKWSPNGKYLASGDDESVIFIWKQKEENELLNIVDITNEQDKEIWLTQKILRGHMEDVYDLCWSPDSKFLISGSVDNTAIMWDIEKGRSVAIFNDHASFVQGVAWDPLNQYIATLSTDRCLRIIDIQTKKIISRNNKSLLPWHECHGKKFRLYHDDTLQTFFRRLCFSPDGKLLIVPAGIIDYEGCTKPVNTTYIYSRYSLKQPAIVLPSSEYTVAVKCCPIFFKLRPHTDSNAPTVPLPYRIVFAVASKSSVYLYDTQQKMPFGFISNIHYTRLTDLAWSKDGNILVVSSTDGFCSLITFSDCELGEKYEKNDVESNKKEIDTIEKMEKSVNDDVAMKDISDKKTENKVSGVNKDQKINGETIKQKQSVPTPIETRKTPRKINHDDNLVSKLPDTAIVLDKDIIDGKLGEKYEKKDVVTVSVESNKKEIDTIEKMEKSVNDDVAMKDISDKKTENKVSDVNKNQRINGETIKQKQSVPTPIETRKTPRKINPDDNLVSKLPDTTIVLDKDIISSAEKFETPEKNNHPATPISIRRQPRNINSPTSTLNTINFKDNIGTKEKETTTPKKSEQQQIENQKLKSSKQATPITIRRQPRNILTTNPVEATAIIEEAVDSWPTNNIETNVENNKKSSTNTKITEKNDISEFDDLQSMEHTEDIRLVYEDTQEESESKQQNLQE